MKISVITATYNSAATLESTLRSVASQRHPDVEHIIVDGASTDDTLSLIRRHGRVGTRVLSEPDQGIYDAMNKGLELARGDLVGFLNADDVYQDEEVLSAVAALATPGVDAVYGDLVYVRREEPDHVVRYWRSGPCTRTRLRFGWMPPHPTLYVRRTAIERVGRFDPDLRIAADYDFMLRLLRSPAVRVAYLDRILVRMRLGGRSNASLRQMYHKSREDLIAARRNGIGGWLTLLCKNVRKLPQFVPDRARTTSTQGVAGRRRRDPQGGSES